MRKTVLTVSLSLLGVLIALAILLGGYYLYLNIFYYTGNSGSHLSERVSQIAIAKQDPSQCDKIKLAFGGALNPFDASEEGYKSSCYLLVAQGLHEVKVCEYVVDSSKSRCVGMFDLTMEDLKICDGIIDQSDKGMCYLQFTKQGFDSSICERIDESNRGTRSSGKERCYYGAAAYSNDISICEIKIQDNSFRNQCYKAVAIGLKDVALCDKIQGQYSEPDRNDCKRYIELNK